MKTFNTVTLPRKTAKARRRPFSKPRNQVGENFNEPVVFAETSSTPINEVQLNVEAMNGPFLQQGNIETLNNFSTFTLPNISIFCTN